MMKSTAWTLVFLILTICVTAVSQEVGPPTVADLIMKGDALKDQGDHEMATLAYLDALKIDPENYEAAWKAGDQFTDFADDIPENEKDRKEMYFEKAKEMCEKAVEINPDGYEGHFRLAVALGRLALFRGGKQKIELSRQIKVEADKALELDQSDDGVYHLLGRWHQNLANLSSILKFFAKALYGGVPPGSNEEAVKLFKKAIEINPEHIEHHLELGRTYKFMGEKELARASLEKAVSLPPVEVDDPEYQEEAKKLLEKL